MTEDGMIGVPLAELCARCHRDFDAVLQLLLDGRSLLVEKAVAEKLVAEWALEDEQRARETHRRRRYGQ